MVKESLRIAYQLFAIVFIVSAAGMPQLIESYTETRNAESNHDYISMKELEEKFLESQKNRLSSWIPITKLK